MQVASRIAAWQSGKKLPYDAEVQWLKSTGVQHINTNLLPNGDSTRVECRFKQEQLTGNYGVFGSRGNLVAYDSTAFNGFVVGGVFRLDWCNQNKSYKVEEFEDWVFEPNGGVVKRNGVALANVSGKTFCSFKMYVFAFNNAGGFNKGYVSFANFKVYENNILVMSLIPVRKDGVGYMYDRVSGELFGNAGTGAFIIGPDKVSNGGGINV